MTKPSLTLYHHPFSRAANVVFMLEEIGHPYELRYIDLTAGEQRSPEFRRVNPMGKLPALADGDMVVTESAAIGLYLADRYAYGRLAPRVDDPACGAGTSRRAWRAGRSARPRHGRRARRRASWCGTCAAGIAGRSGPRVPGGRTWARGCRDG
jgi:glutathione S-transferase